MKRLAPLMIGLLAGGVLASAAAAAQVPGRPAIPPTPPVNNNVRFGTNAGGFQNQLTNEMLERQRENGGQSDERAALIERVWPLIAEGRCEAGRRMAREEGDRTLARRISEICVEGRPTPTPAAD